MLDKILNSKCPLCHQCESECEWLKLLVNQAASVWKPGSLHLFGDTMTDSWAGVLFCSALHSTFLFADTNTLQWSTFQTEFEPPGPRRTSSHPWSSSSLPQQSSGPPAAPWQPWSRCGKHGPAQLSSLRRRYRGRSSPASLSPLVLPWRRTCPPGSEQVGLSLERWYVGGEDAGCV